MPNFVKIPRQMKEFSIQVLYSDRSICMTAICYSGPILVVPINEQLLKKKITCAKFHYDVLKTERLVRSSCYLFIYIYTDPIISFWVFVVNIYPVQGIKILKIFLEDP